MNDKIADPLKWEGIMKIPIKISTIEFHDRISSTSDRIKELLRGDEIPELPVLVVAKTQTAGRGRGAKGWWSAEGALLMSLGWELKHWTRRDLPVFALAVGLSVLETVRHRLPESELNQVRIHWPNDVYIGDRKICGILVESPTPRYAVVGVGVNVNNRSAEVPPEFQGLFAKRPVVSLIDILDRETDISTLIVDILSRLHYNGKRIPNDSQALLRDVSRHCVQIGREMSVIRNGKTIRGNCVGIAPDGSLQLETPDGPESIHSTPDS